MTNLWGTGIFWTTIASVVIVLSLSTLIGRAWAVLLPYKFRATARFYLAPAFGLSSLVIIATYIGRCLPLGNTVVTPLLVGALLLFAIARERNIKQALNHALTVSAFGFFCGISVLAPLYVYGAFNAHNDAFTYLAHSGWLQMHAFGEIISPEKITPLTTQIALYQHGNLRMGGSFLLALVQALLNIGWAYQVYPTVIVAGITTCCISLGFPLANVLRSMNRLVRLSLLAIPAFSFGGLVFAANLGFLPQTIGLALGSAFLFLVGPLFYWIAKTKPGIDVNLKASLSIAVLFIGAALAYSEIVPFIVLAVFVSVSILAIHFRAVKSLTTQCFALLVIVTVLLNAEIVRAYAAIKMQAGSVVGSPVDWTLVGFIAHVFGVHGGAWDGFQWTRIGAGTLFSYVLGISLFILVLGITGVGLYSARKNKVNGGLLPSGVVILIFGLGFIYYRYFVASPFSIGSGQSWSQFKLTDWAHPFVMLFFLFALASFRNHSRKLFYGALTTFFAVGLLNAGAIGVARISPIMNYYKGVSNLDQFYLQLRTEVFARCSEGIPIYLALGGENHKFRQMALLYLSDRSIASDWSDDGYLYPMLQERRRKQELKSGDCLVESSSGDGWLTHDKEIGIVRVGQFDGRGQIRIVSTSGAYDRETDGVNWWHWVERQIVLKVQSRFINKNAEQTKVQFAYGVRGKQTLDLVLTTRDGSNQTLALQGDSDAAVFEHVFDIAPADLSEVRIQTNGIATPLGNGDFRVAAWIIRNINITPVPK